METITVIEQVPAAIGAQDARGDAVPLPSFTAPPVWTVDNPAILTVLAATDGLSATCTAAGLGTATISVIGTPVGGSATLSGTAQVTVTAASASVLTVSFGTPSVQAPPAPAPPVAP